MITFFNFAPIEFMGGAEKWMYETALSVGKKEKTQLLSVHPTLANYYGKLVLKRNYDKRAKVTGIKNDKITFMSLVPGTNRNKNIKDILSSSRRVYARFEVLEAVILFWLGGRRVFQKTIFGLHFPLLYSHPRSFTDRLHNTLYKSFFTKFVLSSVCKVHVITPRDQKLLENKLQLKNVVYAPTTSNFKVVTKFSKKKKGDPFRVLFVGELSLRKGVDVLLSIIKKAPIDYHFDIAGNGFFSRELMHIEKTRDNCTYHGFITGKKIKDLYKKADIFLLPSRAEGFPLVFHEAMANGLMIVSSPEIKIGMPKTIERNPKKFSDEEFIKTLVECQKKITPKRNIVQFYKENYSPKVVNDLLSKNLFN